MSFFSSFFKLFFRKMFLLVRVEAHALFALFLRMLIRRVLFFALLGLVFAGFLVLVLVAVL